jgi:hypothetical protein
MDKITPSPPAWPLQPGRLPPRWDPDDILECTKQQHLAQLDQQLLIAKTELDVASFRRILSKIENIRYGIDPRYQKAPPPGLVTSAATSAFSEDGSPIVDNDARGQDTRKWFWFPTVSRLLRRLQFFRRQPRGRDGGQGVTDESRNAWV